MEVTVGISEPVTSRSNKSYRPTRATYVIQFSSSRSSTSWSLRAIRSALGPTFKTAAEAQSGNWAYSSVG